MKQSNEVMLGSVIQGRVVPANYIDPLIPWYQGNPLIEALPPILSKVAATKALRNYPPYQSSHRTWPIELRLHLIENSLQLFAPLPIHLDIEQRVSRMIRSGYRARNPLAPLYGPGIHARIEALRKNIVGSGPILDGTWRSTANGFTMLGISGIGKSTALERTLSLYPQVVLHNKHNKRDFNLVQIVWLKLDCPNDGSIRGLCANFFYAVDCVLGTNYYMIYTGHRQSADEMLPAMANIAARHSLGVLVIDEIQHLNEAHSGGSARMLNFFVQLINIIGVPVVLVGTYKAKAILSSEFRQARRGSGQGDLIWDQMLPDNIWTEFLVTLFRYQYTDQEFDYTEELSTALYDVTQGITDFAVKVFILAQARAIVRGKPIVTPDIIRSVATDSLRLANPIIFALKSKNISLLERMEDVYLDLGELLALEAARENSHNTSGSETTLGNSLEKSSTGSDTQAFTNSESIESIPPHETTLTPDVVSDVDTSPLVYTSGDMPEALSTKKNQRNRSGKRNGSDDPESLLTVAAQDQVLGTAVDALRAQNYIKDITDFSSGDDLP